MTLDTVPHDVTVDDAEAIVVGTDPLPPAVVPIGDAMGRWLGPAPQGTNYRARWDLPSAPVSVMDGWAVRAEDVTTAFRDGKTKLSLRVAGESAAGHPHDTPLRPGEAAQVSTGAVVPPGADAVIPREESTRDKNRNGDTLSDTVTFDATALAQTQAGRYVRPAGSDVTRGQTLLDPGTHVGPGEYALLAGAGVWEVAAHPRPRVALIGTGDELVAVGTAPTRGQVVSTNVDMLAAQVSAAGGVTTRTLDAPDRPQALYAALRSGLDADVLVTTGGASVGDHDLVFAQLRRLGYEPRFVRVRLRPGRPTVFGFIDRTPVLMLPGNPASSHVAFELFGAPLLRRLAGCPASRARRTRRALELGAEVQPMRSRDKYDRARLDADGRVVPLAAQQSGALRSIAGYDVLLRIPAGTEPLPRGSTVEVIEVRW